MKDDFDLWWESATPEALEAGKQKILSKANAFMKKNLEGGDPRMVKAIYRIFFERHRADTIRASLTTEEERKVYLAKLFAEPEGWEDQGTYLTKWDEVTRSVLRKPKFTPSKREKPAKETWHDRYE